MYEVNFAIFITILIKIVNNRNFTYFDGVKFVGFFLNLSRRMKDVSGSILLDLRESLVIRYKDIALVGFVIRNTLDSSLIGEEYKSSRGFREYTRTT